jgi:A/G-specific adenine glycosylase
LPKPVKPTRYGISYVAQREDGAVLLETRPEKGVLGGMLGWPGSDWAEDVPDHAQPLQSDWVTLNEQVRHTFTHFHLILTVKRSEIGMNATSDRGVFVSPQDFNKMDLPTVMRKVWAIAQP